MKVVTIWPVVGAAVLGMAACSDPGPVQSVFGNGRIEADEVRVASEVPGRVTRLAVREGDAVERGQVLAELASDEWEAQLRRAEAEVRAARQALARVEAQVETLEHHARSARVEYQRMRNLYASGAVAGQQVDRAENALKEAEGQSEAAAAQLEQARATVEAAKAAEALARTKLADTRVRSPLDGSVLLRLAEEGEVVQPGQPLFVLIDPRDLHLKVYVEERRVGDVRIGAPASVHVDAFEGRVFEGVVTEVAQQAEFTPRDIHMPDERATLVFGVEIRLENPEGYLKPGMPADAEILVANLGGGAKTDDRAREGSTAAAAR